MPNQNQSTHAQATPSLDTQNISLPLTAAPIKPSKGKRANGAGNSIASRLWTAIKPIRYNKLKRIAPGPKTASISLFALTSFLALLAIFTSLAIHMRDRKHGLQITLSIIGGLNIFGLLCLVLRHAFPKTTENQSFHSNLGNTVLVVIITISTFVPLYIQVWYPALRTEILTASVDVADKAMFPAVAIFQRIDWTSAGTLRGNSSKCFLGWYNDTAPMCSTIAPDELVPGVTCNCKDAWYNDDQIIDNFVWQNTTYRYLAFTPDLQCNSPTYRMLLQAFFTFNATRALDDSSHLVTVLQIAVWDPAISLMDALQARYTRMNMIDANGIVSINLALRTRQVNGYPEAYDYDLSISASPATGITCDVSQKLWYPCFTSLFLQIPNFDRVNIRSQRALSWLDVAASAGSYFSFAQFLAWILSGQALHRG